MKTSSNQSSGGRSLVNEPAAAGEAAHTPTPYRFMDVGNPKGMLRIEVANGTAICPGHVSHQAVAWTDNQPTKREDAAFIVRACNSHAALVEALRGAQLALRTVACRVENKEPDLGAYCHAEANKAYEPLRVMAARALGV